MCLGRFALERLGPAAAYDIVVIERRQRLRQLLAIFLQTSGALDSASDSVRASAITPPTVVQGRSRKSAAKGMALRADFSALTRGLTYAAGHPLAIRAERGPCLRWQFHLWQTDLASLGRVRACVWHYIPVSSAEGPYVAGTGMLFRRR
jgi:hypothetical protein